ncbi:hypothetical protein [uncultured Paludibaculum sp.]|uniref:hypothetical protein n=1 Tax=uncultured Paludibaculum sp. TaxID=1765020 RepID=UPI002AAC088A|nr:hypothetical protein [uncultured Paludibaculum sp.]
MTMSTRASQAWVIARIEMRRAFFSKRAFWVYLLALFPSVIFLGHALEIKVQERRWASGPKVSSALIDGVSRGETDSAVLKRLGEPADDNEWNRRKYKEEVRPNGQRRYEEQPELERHRHMVYFDGKRRVNLHFVGGLLESKNVREVGNFEEDRSIYAGVFQYFYLRLAIFFGCLGIFMNLFRGEMLDKTLHFWFLFPTRREVLLLGKYLAGLTAACVIFGGGAMLSYWAMLWPHSGVELQAYWQSVGWSHAVWYATAAVLGCVGYGSVFVAAGLLLRNPIIPAAVLLVWEGINGFLPEILQKLSVLHYLQSLCPVPAPVDSGTPALMKMLLNPAAPASKAGAILGLLAVTVLVLWAASRAVRRLEINYGTE